MSRYPFVSNPFARLAAGQRRYFFFILLLFVALAAAVTIVSIRLRSGAAKKITVHRDTDHVKSDRLQPIMQTAVSVMGDRLEKSGREVLSATGTLTRNTTDGLVTNSARVVWQQPNHIRIEENRDGKDVVTTFDGQRSWTSAGLPNQQTQDLIESLVFDSADHFFLAQMRELSVKSLGGHFRLDDGSDQNYKGPYYDAYQVHDRISIGAGRAQYKQYFFNSNTLLLELVRYEIERGGKPVTVQVKLDNWQLNGPDRFPSTITRLENGQQVLSLTIDSVTVSGKLDNGLFTQGH